MTYTQYTAYDHGTPQKVFEFALSDKCDEGPIERVGPNPQKWNECEDETLKIAGQKVREWIAATEGVVLPVEVMSEDNYNCHGYWRITEGTR